MASSDYWLAEMKNISSNISKLNTQVNEYQKYKIDLIALKKRLEKISGNLDDTKKNLKNGGLVIYGDIPNKDIFKFGYNYLDDAIEDLKAVIEDTGNCIDDMRKDASNLRGKYNDANKNYKDELKNKN